MKNKKLFRVDIGLKYLTLQEKRPTVSEVHDWVNNAHGGELDDKVSIVEVDNSEQIQDFDDDYTAYDDEGDEGELTKFDIVQMLMLDLDVVRKRLEAAGYEIVKKK